jgi:hypothetical protein
VLAERREFEKVVVLDGPSPWTKALQRAEQMREKMRVGCEEGYQCKRGLDFPVMRDRKMVQQRAKGGEKAKVTLLSCGICLAGRTGPYR